MNKMLILVLCLFVLGGGYYYVKNLKTSSPVRPANTNAGAAVGSDEVIGESTGTSGTPADSADVKTFSLDSFEFGFDQKTITVKKGDTVTLTLTNSGKMNHDWVVDELNARTKQIRPGETDTVTFVADKTGTFEYYCSVGSHRKMGMVGKLIVE